jgi:hypothetical protein
MSKEKGTFDREIPRNRSQFEIPGSIFVIQYTVTET